MLILAQHLSQEAGKLLFSAWISHACSLWVLQDPASVKDWSDIPLFRRELPPFLILLLVMEAGCSFSWATRQINVFNVMFHCTGSWIIIKCTMFSIFRVPIHFGPQKRKTFWSYFTTDWFEKMKWLLKSCVIERCNSRTSSFSLPFYMN